MANLLGGVAWRHFALQYPIDISFLRPSTSTKTARILVLQPEFLGTISRRLSLPPPAAATEPMWDIDNWMLGHISEVRDKAYYSTFRPNRPDPATCSEQEFVRYLRAVAGGYPKEIISRDLAEYAPRFAHVLALYVRYYHVAPAAIGNGVPESLKEDVISVIDSSARTYPLLTTLADRNWVGLARQPLLTCLGPSSDGQGDMSLAVAAVAGLEDPATYPLLLAAYERTRSSRFYDIIRLLPGITPELDKSVERVSQGLSPSHDRNGASFIYFSDALPEFLAPVSAGNPVAFAKLFQLGQTTSMRKTFSDPGLGKIIRQSPMPDRPDKWEALFKEKSPADFTYDSLARCWRPVSKAP